MTRYLILSFLAIMLHIIPVFGQPAYNKTTQFLNANKVWAMQRTTGLDFRNGVAVPITTAMPESTGRLGEGAATACDPATGRLLFYSDGMECWNENHQRMPNGNNLLGNQTTSTMQGVCIVPVIGEPDKYYLFSLNYEGKRDPSGSLFYNIVDMSLDNGKGDIVSGKKNILLDSSSLSEAMIAIPGNDCDVWLMVHAYGIDKTVASGIDYLAYHITSAGINPVPVVSQGKKNVLYGTMTVSPDRSRIALSASRHLYYIYDHGGSEIVKFDPNTGRVSDPIVLPLGLPTPGVPTIFGTGSETMAFSPDNTKLYCDKRGITADLYQFNISNYDSTAIAQSGVTVGAANTWASVKLRLYNDTIYVLGSKQEHVGIISSPDVSGTACGYVSNAISLGTGAFHIYALPAEMVLPPAGDTIFAKQSDTLICSAAINQQFFARPGFTAYEWSTGSTDTSIAVSQYGTYWVMSKDFCHSFVDTFVVSGEYLPTPVINVDGYVLSTGTYHAYQWYKNGVAESGETDSIYTATQNAMYSVKVTNIYGCTDSAFFEVTNVGLSDMSQLAKAIRIYPNPASHTIHISAPVAVNVSISSLDGRLQWRQDQTDQIDISSLSTGIYLIRVVDMSGMLIKNEKLIKID